MQRLLEICCSDIESVDAAIAGGADRIELCSALSEGGVTPSAGMISEATKRKIPVNVLIRPRGGDFVYTKTETEIMLADIDIAASLGANGVVIGALRPDGLIDTEISASLISKAQSLGLETTYHRAFDMCSDPDSSLETIISLGANRLLTSGLAATALNGAEFISRLRIIADNRIKIMAGCGVTPMNVAEIIHKSGVVEIHASAKTRIESSMSFRNMNAKMGTADDYSRTITSKEIVNNLSKIIHEYDTNA